MKEKGVSHIAYFRLDGGSSKLYTQEYVDEKDLEIERLKADLHEANDSVTWWQNRFNSEHKQIEDLKEQVEYQDLWGKEYLSRIDKAIEYIEERKKLNWYAEGVFVYDLLNILQGVDKE